MFKAYLESTLFEYVVIECMTCVHSACDTSGRTARLFVITQLTNEFITVCTEIMEFIITTQCTKMIVALVDDRLVDRADLVLQC